MNNSFYNINDAGPETRSALSPTYIVTGASGDIGGAVAVRLAESGCNLALIGHSDEAALEAVRTTCASFGCYCKTYAGDLGDEDFVRSTCRDIQNSFPGINGLIHTAGASSVGLLGDMSLTDWNRLMATNLTSAFLCIKHITPALRAAGSGRILLISSVWGSRGASMEAAYSATKGGLDSLTKAMAKELAPCSISVNALAPGMVSTKMNSHLSEDDIAELCEEIPAGRVTTPDEVADMVALLMNAPLYLTGEIIGFNGGWF